MPKVNCDVIGCTNSTCRLNKWKKEVCNEHEQIICRKECSLSEKPFLLYKLPAAKQKNKERQLCIKALRREFINRNYGSQQVVIGYAPYTLLMEFLQLQNPTPTLRLGNELEAKKSRRNLFKHPAPIKKQKLDQIAATNSSTFITLASEQPPYSKDVSTDLDRENNLQLANVLFFSPVSDHPYCSIQSSKVCKVCVDKNNLIESLVSKVNALILTKSVKSYLIVLKVQYLHGGKLKLIYILRFLK